MTSALRGAPAIGAALLVLAASACTPATTPDPAPSATAAPAGTRSEGAAIGGSSASSSASSSAPPSSGNPATSAPTTGAADDDSPYHLDIPSEDQHEVSRWVSGERGGTVMFDDVKAGRDYRIDGACIYGYGDELNYRVLDARPTKVRDRTIAEGSVLCDGHVHTHTLRVRVTGPVQLLPGETGDKTVAYLRVLPGAR